ncbi:hypothetical protein BU15DRAFT_75424 [Melanogaster broomeanus]|nr:hypothetical protein BU15DRAFT_75424 [Melanogaster broomeanus]
MLSTNVASVLAVVFLPLVSASIYPTQPIQDTVWSADRPALATWLDDGKYPTLDVMGPCQILLYRDVDTYLTTLASDVDPQALSQQVTVPGNLLHAGSRYTLQFVTDSDVSNGTSIYTADFSITPANTTSGSVVPTISTGTFVPGTQSGGTASSAPTFSMGLAPKLTTTHPQLPTAAASHSIPGDAGGGSDRARAKTPEVVARMVII